MNIPAISGLGNVTAVQPNAQRIFDTADSLRAPTGMRGVQPNAQPIIDTAGFLRPPAGVTQVESEGAQSFDTVFSAYMDMVNSAGRLDAQAQHLQIEYALGNHDDMLAVILAQEMAFTSLHFTVQVTNRIIQAYQEIMRMQI